MRLSRSQSFLSLTLTAVPLYVTLGCAYRGLKAFLAREVKPKPTYIRIILMSAVP